MTEFTLTSVFVVLVVLIIRTEIVLVKHVTGSAVDDSRGRTRQWHLSRDLFKTLILQAMDSHRWMLPRP